MNVIKPARALLIALLWGAAAVAQPAAFPDRNVLMVVAGSPGGGLDLTGRALEQTMLETRLLPTGFVLKHMGGAGGNLAKTYVHQRGGDAYTLYVESNRIYVNRLVGTTQLDHRDLTPIARLTTEYLVWVVRADSPFKSAKDVLDKLKGNPGSVVFGVGTVPSNDQMNILRPALAYGIDPKQIKIVPFKSGGDLMIQLLGGHVPVISTGLSEAIEQVKAGRARVLAVSSPKPLEGEIARVPTWRSMGIGVEILHWRGLFAPPGTPASTVKYWDQTLARMVRSDSWKKALDKHGWFNAYASSAPFRKDLDREAKVYTEILTKLGMLKARAAK
ncbi:MAG: tripartite tricarboxylate transporter substrate binding protein [Betaproteobacteria bacterium]|nr:tripartite tricarboxylate transporter substrate binding protein [Betaproteobacteria bacterium]